LHTVPTGFSGIALNRMEIWNIQVDHITHMLIFLPWMFIVWLHLNAKRIYGNLRFRYALLFFIAGLLLAVIAEIIQYWFPYRSFNPVDMIFNVTGVLIGSIIFIFNPIKHKH